MIRVCGVVPRLLSALERKTNVVFLSGLANSLPFFYLPISLLMMPNGLLGLGFVYLDLGPPRHGLSAVAPRALPLGPTLLVAMASDLSGAFLRASGGNNHVLFAWLISYG